jgi:hypothetical protein
MQHSTLGFLTLNLPPLVAIAAASDEGFRSVVYGSRARR